MGEEALESGLAILLCCITIREGETIMQGEAAYRPVRMGDMRATLTEGPDGVLYVRSSETLGPYPRSMTDLLARWASERPDMVFLADRGPDGAWRQVTYAQAYETVQSLAQALLDAGLNADKPLLILSGNEIEHALLGYAAMLVGVPHAPLSPAYSLVSKDFAKLKHIVGLIEPGMVYASDGAAFGPAIAATIDPATPLIVRRNPPADRSARLFDALAATVATPAVAAANAAVTPDTIAKFLFTSGSTGMPKAVITTQRMLTCNQEMIRTALAFLADEPPVLVDWMPWNHVAGGSHNLGIALYNGGSFYVDDGAATSEGMKRTARNLTEIAPTIYVNVPKGYEFLVEHLATNVALRDKLFSRLKVLQYAGASLAQHVWDGLDAAAHAAAGERIRIITGYGSTETAPFAFTTTWTVDRAGMVGLPAAGMEIKLVPSDEKLELRLRGPNVTPGYWKQPDKTAEAFDEEGYYKIGDALKFADPGNISKGFVFDGRVTEDFKLATGTWVNMGGVRLGALAAGTPLLRDLVLTGLDRNFIGALIFPDLEACRRLAGLDATANPEQIVAHPVVRAAFQERFDALAAKATGSASHIARAILLAAPPAIDAGEITDKGSINQRAVIATRAQAYADLYADPVSSHVLTFARKAS
jgi:feruloyl-CoA synthase